MGSVTSRSSPLLVDRPTLARVLGVSVRQIGMLESSGHIVPTVRGKAGRASQYDLTAVVPSYIASANDQKENPRDRKDLASAELTELRIAKERGQLVEAAAVEKEFADVATAVKARLRSIPDTVADQLLSMAGEGSAAAVKAFLLSRIDAALRDLAAMAPAAEDPGEAA